MMWKKHVGGWTSRDRKPLAIGQPVLLETTIEDSLLSRLPTAQQASLAAQHTQSATTSPIEASQRKELPPLDFQRERKSRIPRPVSEVPTTSSVYTRQTPEFRHDFDPNAKVSPLFSHQQGEFLPPGNAQSYASGEAPMHEALSLVPPNKNNLTVQPTFRERLEQAQARSSGLAIQTSSRRQWQGASGETEPMTPIAASTMTGTESTRSVSPIDERLDIENMLLRKGGYQYPTPESISHGVPRASNLPPPPELRTPTMDQSDGVSVGYDVSPWSTPASRPYHGATTQESTPSRTPGRTPSYPRRSTSGASPAYRRALAYKKRLSWATRATEEDKYTEFEVSTQASERPSLDSGVGNDSLYGEITAGPYWERKERAKAPPPQQRSASAGTVSQKQRLPDLNFTPPKFSRFSWTTQATETTAGREDPRQNRGETPRQVSAPQTVLFLPQEDSPAEQSSPPSPILTRRRPVATSPHLDGHPALAKTSGTRQIKRKPTPSMMTFGISPLETQSLNDKALPTTPAELSTHDYITELDAQLESLRNRKHNIMKVIQGHQSVSLSPTVNPMVVDLEKRKRTKEAVRALEDELAEVRRAEHEKGLKLMRAEKRRDQEAPTALWIRRVRV